MILSQARAASHLRCSDNLSEKYKGSISLCSDRCFFPYELTPKSLPLSFLFPPPFKMMMPLQWRKLSFSPSPCLRDPLFPSEIQMHFFFSFFFFFHTIFSFLCQSSRQAVCRPGPEKCLPDRFTPITVQPACVLLFPHGIQTLRAQSTFKSREFHSSTARVFFPAFKM